MNPPVTKPAHDNPQKVWLETLLALGRILIFAALPAIGWLMGEVLRHRDSITAIEATRFTESDGVGIERRVEASILKLSDNVRMLRTEVAALPKEVPPAWFIDRVSRLEAQGEANRQAQVGYEKQMAEVLALLIAIQADLHDRN